MELLGTEYGITSLNQHLESAVGNDIAAIKSDLQEIKEELKELRKIIGRLEKWGGIPRGVIKVIYQVLHIHIYCATSQ